MYSYPLFLLIEILVAVTNEERVSWTDIWGGRVKAGYPPPHPTPHTQINLVEVVHSVSPVINLNANCNKFCLYPPLPNFTSLNLDPKFTDPRMKPHAHELGKGVGLYQISHL